jgi:hypothetical protein
MVRYVKGGTVLAYKILDEKTETSFRYDAEDSICAAQAKTAMLCRGLSKKGRRPLGAGVWAGEISNGVGVVGGAATVVPACASLHHCALKHPWILNSHRTTGESLQRTCAHSPLPLHSRRQCGRLSQTALFSSLIRLRRV